MMIQNYVSTYKMNRKYDALLVTLINSGASYNTYLLDTLIV